MTRRILPALLALAAAACAQYNDYPTGEYEFVHDRFVVSPLKVVGGMDPDKRDEGPKVDVSWTPNVDLVEARYEHILGVDGTVGLGAIGTYYPTLDSIKGTIWAAGLFGRYYMDLAHGGYVQLAAQWYQQDGTKVRNGVGTAASSSGGDATEKSLADAKVAVSGPQFSPVLGYCYLVGVHLVLEAQMGFTFGSYTRSVSGGPYYVATNNGADTVTYKSGTSWGGFYFAQVSIGVAW
jgi:hypothetical protein